MSVTLNTHPNALICKDHTVSARPGNEPSLLSLLVDFQVLSTGLHPEGKNQPLPWREEEGAGGGGRLSLLLQSTENTEESLWGTAIPS